MTIYSIENIDNLHLESVDETRTTDGTIQMLAEVYCGKRLAALIHMVDSTVNTVLVVPENQNLTPTQTRNSVLSTSDNELHVSVTTELVKRYQEDTLYKPLEKYTTDRLRRYLNIYRDVDKYTAFSVTLMYSDGKITNSNCILNDLNAKDNLGAIDLYVADKFKTLKPERVVVSFYVSQRKTTIKTYRP